MSTSDDRNKGAGSVGGLLFLAVLLFLGYLVITTIAGVIKWLLGVGILVLIVLIGVRVVTRR